LNESTGTEQIQNRCKPLVSDIAPALGHSQISSLDVQKAFFQHAQRHPMVTENNITVRQ
jgi:hypothetical protein